MLAFEKLDVYNKAKDFNFKILDLLKNSRVDWHIDDQMRRASLSVMLNIAEGAGRVSGRDKRRFHIIARSSGFECAALLEFLAEYNQLEESKFREFYSDIEEISKMLYSLIKQLS